MVSRVAGTITLLVLAALVALRPLITETYDSAQSALDRALETIADPTPLRTLILDVLILVSALVTTLACRRGRAGRIRPPAWVWGFLLIVVAGGVSCLVAGNKRLAINATIDWLCLPILTLTLVRLLRGPWQRRLLLAAIVGSATVQVLECYEQYTYGFAETIEQYERHKDEFWRSQGVAPDAPQVDLFESRMNAREVSGFLPHSNVAGSYLVLIAFCGLGLSLARMRRWRRMRDPVQRAFGIVIILVTIAVVVVIPSTGSRGAMLAGAGALALWGACRVFGGSIRRNRRVVFVAGWIAFGLVVAGTIGYGLRHKSLPGVSLTFRWQYWTASAEMVADHPWTGVGRENFGRHYLRYKSIRSPEEVSNPHNLFVQAAADWGVPGLIGMILLLIGGSHAVVLGRQKEPDETGDGPALSEGSSHAPLSTSARGGAFAVLTLMTLGMRVPLLGTEDPNYVYYTTVTSALAWLVGAGAVWFWSERRRHANDDESDTVIATCVAWGLLAFLVHDLINFALFVPATATTFFALGAYVMSTQGRCEPSNGVRSRRRAVSAGTGWDKRRWSYPVFLGVFVAVISLFGLVPVARSGAYLRRARDLSVRLPVDNEVATHPARVAFEQAARVDPFDPTPLAEQGQWLAAVADAHPDGTLDTLDLAGDSIRRAIVRDPFRASLPRVLRRVCLMRAAASGLREDYAHAIDAARRVLGLYPEDPGGLALLADTLANAGAALDDPTFSREAIDRYEAALQLDDQRIEWETLRRFRPKKAAEMRERIEEIRRRNGVE